MTAGAVWFVTEREDLPERMRAHGLMHRDSGDLLAAGADEIVRLRGEVALLAARAAGEYRGE